MSRMTEVSAGMSKRLAPGGHAGGLTRLRRARVCQLRITPKWPVGRRDRSARPVAMPVPTTLRNAWWMLTQPTLAIRKVIVGEAQAEGVVIDGRQQHG